MKRFLIFLLYFSVAFAKSTYVTCNFRGQLGNQLFQTAATVAYALDHGCVVSFPAITKAERGEENYRYFLHRISTSPFPRKTDFRDFHETHYATYEPLPYQEGTHLRLNGHFVSEKYFAHHRDYILDLFAPTPELLQTIHQTYNTLLQDITVAIHIRTFIPDGRKISDFNPESKCWWYFLDAIHYFPEHYHFVIFSDRIDIVKKNFPHTERKITFIEDNPYYIDFYLMSLCKHQIVSPGSTYSWWAAWLNKNPNKIVIVCDTWSGQSGENAIPDNWIRIKAWGADE